MKERHNCVMLIDDDKLINFSNSILIQETGHFDCIIQKNSAQAALSYLSSSASGLDKLPFPDIILLDIEMPVLSGWDFLDFYSGIKHLFPFYPKIFIVSSRDRDLAGKRTGIAGFFKKPLDVSMLETILEK